jgi:hypothetical protein
MTMASFQTINWDDVELDAQKRAFRRLFRFDPFSPFSD